MTGRSSIVIVGGGASGVILAAHLMRSPRPDIRVTLVEQRDKVGHGLAYSTTLPEHRLNVVAGRMSAFADAPLHFWDWLRSRRLATGNDPAVYVPRMYYGQYLSELFGQMLDREKTSGRLRRVQQECVAVAPNASGVDVKLANGTSIASHVVVLATGHDREPTPQNPYAIRSGSQDDTPLDSDARVVILGSGLSMIDTWLSLRDRGHRGEVVVISRRGLLPQPHRPKRMPIELDAADIPLGTELSYFTRWFHELIEERGGEWRDVIDGIRPFNQRIWQDWPTSAKKRFLEHTKAWWDIHRHRIAPDIHEDALRAIHAGKLSLIAGKITETKRKDDGYVLRLRRRGQPATEELACARIYDCTGLIRDLNISSSPLVQSLIEHQVARVDQMRLGLDVNADCALKDGNGTPSDRLFAMGPLTRGTFFEIDAVPDIREQAARLASILAGPDPGHMLL